MIETSDSDGQNNVTPPIPNQQQKMKPVAEKEPNALKIKMSPLANRFNKNLINEVAELDDFRVSIIESQGVANAN